MPCPSAWRTWDGSSRRRPRSPRSPGRDAGLLPDAHLAVVDGEVNSFTRYGSCRAAAAWAQAADPANAIAAAILGVLDVGAEVIPIQVSDQQEALTGPRAGSTANTSPAPSIPGVLRSPPVAAVEASGDYRVLGSSGDEIARISISGVYPSVFLGLCRLEGCQRGCEPYGTSRRQR